MKSVNLQYITLGCLDDGTNESSTKSLMFQLLFFYTFYRLRAPKTLYFYNFIKKLENKLKGKNFARNHEKKNTWNIRRLVNDSFVPSSKRPSVLYCKLTDLWSGLDCGKKGVGPIMSNFF